MQLVIHVLSLEREVSRRKAVCDRLRHLGLEHQVTDAIDARKVERSHLEAAFGRRVASGMSPATPGDMACTLGHLAIWRKIATAPGAAAVVLEDDVKVDGDLRRFCDADVVALMDRHSAGLLRLEARRGERLFGSAIDADLWRLTSAAFGTAGYVVSRRAAAWLAARFDPPGRPVDHLLWGPLSPARRALRPLVIRPAVVAQDVARFPSIIAVERDALGTRRPTLRDRAGRLVTSLAVATGRAEPIGEVPGHRNSAPRNEPGTRL